MISLILAWLAGVFSLLFYIVWRMLRSDGWDHSNILNALRVISHVAAHPEDLAKMWYVRKTPSGLLLEQRPFDYIDQDEFKGVVPYARPHKEAV